MDSSALAPAGIVTRGLDAVLRTRAALSLRARTGRERYVRSVYGPYLRHTPDDRTFELCVTGYGRFVSNAIRSHELPFVFLDVGANCGVFTLMAARHRLCRRAIAIEPVPRTFASLLANIAFNRARNVQAVRAAVCDDGAGEVRLTWDPGHSGMASAARPGGAQTVTAPALDGAGLAAIVGDVPCPVFAKIDVEGGEAGVLSALERSPFAGNVSDVVIEISARNCGEGGADRIRAALTGMGFAEIGRDGPSDHHDAHYRRLRVGNGSR